MKSSYSFITILSASLTVASCGNKNTMEENPLKANLDSVCADNTQLRMMLDNMTGTVAEISLSLDSITRLENMIVLGRDEEGNRLSKKSIKAKLQALSELIAHQRERMATMDSSLVAEQGRITT